MEGKAERGGDPVKAVQPGRLVHRHHAAFLLEDLVQVGPQAAAHPVPRSAAEAPRHRGTHLDPRGGDGALT